MFNSLIFVNFLKFRDFSEHCRTLTLNDLNLLLSLRNFLFYLCHLQLLLLCFSLKSRSFRVLLLQLLLRALLLLRHVLILLLLLAQGELVLLQLALSLFLLVLDGFDALLVSQLSFRLLLGQHSEALFHLVDLVVHALVVAVLGAQTLDLGFQRCNKLFFLLSFHLQTNGAC